MVVVGTSSASPTASKTIASSSLLPTEADGRVSSVSPYLTGVSSGVLAAVVDDDDSV